MRLDYRSCYVLTFEQAGESHEHHHHPAVPRVLGVTGDVTTELRVPFDRDEDRFHLAISDGTLIVGEYDPEDDRFRYQVEIEGAGITRFAGDTVTVDWRPEWVTIGVYQPVPARTIEPQPLFETILADRQASTSNPCF